MESIQRQITIVCLSFKPLSTLFSLPSSTTCLMLSISLLCSYYQYLATALSQDLAIHRPSRAYFFYHIDQK